MHIAAHVPVAEVEYPEDDGLPMSDNSLQAQFILLIAIGLDLMFMDDDNTLVALNLLWYPVEGNNLIRTAPDVFVVKGRPRGVRGSYLQWREDGIPPQVVWEVLSPGNRAGEMQEKFEFYERYGVLEYYQYDPQRGTLRGWKREREELIEIERILGWISPLLRIRLELHEGELVLHDPDGKKFLTHQELKKQNLHFEAGQRSEKKAKRKAQAATRAAKVRAERERIGREQAEAAKQAAEAQAERERVARTDAEAQAERERAARTDAEAQAERERAARTDAEAQAERERVARADAEALTARLAEKLRQLGINPEA